MNPDELERKEEEIKNAPNQDMDDAINFLFDKGFIARYTKYESG